MARPMKIEPPVPEIPEEIQMTPVHLAIAALDETIAALRRQRGALVATLPPRPRPGEKCRGRRRVWNPIKGKYDFF